MRKQLLFGLLLGIVIPIIGALLYTLFFSDLSIGSSLETLQEQKRIGSLVTLGALPNLLVFFLCIRKKKDLIARGILMGTFVWAIVMVLLKFF